MRPTGLPRIPLPLSRALTCWAPVLRSLPPPRRPRPAVAGVRTICSPWARRRRLQLLPLITRSRAAWAAADPAPRPSTCSVVALLEATHGDHKVSHFDFFFFFHVHTCIYTSSYSYYYYNESLYVEMPLYCLVISPCVPMLLSFRNFIATQS